MRVALLVLLALGLAGACGGDDDGPTDGAPGSVADAPASSGDAAGHDGGGDGVCSGSDDCDGEVCCDPGGGGECVPSFEDCTGLVLCDRTEECPQDLVCCPQGFCGGCD